MSAPAIRTHLGVSRATWRVGRLHWLSQAEHARFAELSRQANFLFDLNRYLRDEHFSVSVPEIVISHAGALVVADAGYVWCLTRDLPGFHPDVADPSMYRALMEGLARFHIVLGAYSKCQPSNVHDGICVKTRQNIARLAEENFVAFTSDSREKELLQQSGAWLIARLDRFERLPRQIVHGDWTPRNVLFDRANPPKRLSAVLDFEAAAWDPVCVDVANTCSTLLMWSGLDRLDERIGEVLDTYTRWAGVHLEPFDIHTAMLAHWLCHYWHWRDRLQSAEFGREVKERLCLRISSVLSYVSTNTADSHEK
jgi:Ser/Thr protein kinase RdoA (MazF antagonist)